MTKLLTLSDRDLSLPRMISINEDFHEFVTGDTWTSLVADTTPTVTVGDAVGGIIALYTDTTNENEVAVKTTKELFKFAADKPIRGAWRQQFTEVSTNTANVFHGFCDAIGANTLVDAGAGPKTTASAMGFYKVDGGLNWYAFASLSTTQTKVELSAANTLTKLAYAAGSSSYQVLEVEFLPKNSTQADIHYYIDGVLVYKITDFVFTSATEMQVGSYAKTGTGSALTVNVDYIQAQQLR